MLATPPPAVPPIPPPEPPRRRFAYGRWLLVGTLAAFLVVVLTPKLQRKLVSRAYRFYRHSVRPPGGTATERTPALEGYGVRGVDVSSYQGDIDWPTVAKEPGMRFAFVKATEGRTWLDPYFDENWKLLSRTPLARGAYHFYRPNRDAAQQAELFIATVVLEPGDLPPVLDVEKTDGRSAAVIRAGVQTWLRLAEKHYGLRPILYTNHDFYVKYFAGYFDEYPLWLAHYLVRQPRLTAERWAFWQHSDEALVPGIRGFVDSNVFGGSEADFEELRLGHPPVAPPLVPKAKKAPKAKQAKPAKKKRRATTTRRAQQHQSRRE